MAKRRALLWNVRFVRRFGEQPRLALEVPQRATDREFQLDGTERIPTLQTAVSGDCEIQKVAHPIHPVQLT